jgi:hypothetical protein
LPSGAPLSYTWDINGDGVYGDATGATPTVDWATLQGLGIVDNSQYSVVLQVTDTVSGVSGISGTSLYVGNPYATLTADAGGPYTIDEGQSLALDASLSWDPNGNPLTYSWDVNGDGVYGDATGVSPTLTWAELTTLGITAGSSYGVSVEVDNGSTLAYSATASLTVNAVAVGTAPTATVSAPLDGYQGVRGQSREVELTATDPSPEDQAAGFSFSVDWGDGTVDNLVGLSGTTASHIYTSEGLYAVSVVATDQNGDTSDPAGQSLAIQVSEQ